MSSTSTTEFYGLTQYVGTDKPSFTDNNEAFRNVDADLHEAVVGVTNQGEAISAIRATVALLGESVVTLQSDFDTEKGKIVNLQSKETLQDAEIADVKADAQNMITAYVEATATSTHAYAAGDFFIYNDVLYKATDTIAIGDTIVPDTNCTTDNVTTELLAINTALNSYVEVTGDGVKTNKQLLNALYALIDFDKINPRTTLRFGGDFYRVNNDTGTNYSYEIANVNTSQIRIRTVHLDSSNSSVLQGYSVTGATAVSDISDNVASNNFIIRLYY